MSLSIVPRDCCCDDDRERERTELLLAEARADLLAYYSPDGMTPDQILVAQRLMNRGYGYGLSMRVARADVPTCGEVA